MKKIISMLLSTIVVLSMFVFCASSVSADQTSDVQDFVTRLYSVCLDRSPDQGGLNDWSNKLINHEATGCSAAYGFIFSNEFQSKNCTNTQYVTYMYSAFFGRTPDQAGLNDWVSRLDGGATRESVFCGFANSVEFGTLCSSYGIVRGFHIEGQNYNQVAMVNLFVDRLYNVVLNRTCDNGGMADWTNQLVNHTNSGCGVAYGFVFSPEFKAKNLCNEHYVDTLYMAFMGRTADTAGKNAWVAQLDSGVSREAVFNGFAGSQEFMGICNSYGIESGSINITGEGTYANGGTCALCGRPNPVITPAPSNTSTPGNGNAVVTPTTVPTSAPATTVTPTITPEPTPTPDIFVRDGNRVYYYVDGVKQFGWQTINNNRYYFSLRNGIMQTGTVNIPEYENQPYREQPIYHFNDDGVMQTGWQELRGIALGTDRLYWHYFNEDGKAQIGWLKYNNNWYYFDNYGHMQTEWLTIDGAKYYADPDTGKLKKGWFEYEEYWYYFDTTSYKMVTGWKQMGDYWYYFKDDGRLCTDGVYNISDSYYLFDSEGRMQTGWYNYDSRYPYWRYFDPVTGKGVTNCWREIDGKYYHFSANGVIDTQEFVDGYWVDENGVRRTGWIQVDTFRHKWSYLDPNTLTLAIGWREINGKIYYFCNGNEDCLPSEWERGYMLTGLAQLPNSRGGTSFYYFNSDGQAQRGLIHIYGDDYYFFDDYTAACNEDVTLSDGRIAHCNYSGRILFYDN